jgi:hypothetical protein
MFVVSVGRFHIPDYGVLEQHSHFTLLCLQVSRGKDKDINKKIVILGFIARGFVKDWWMSADVTTMLPLMICTNHSSHLQVYSEITMAVLLITTLNLF